MKWLPADYEVLQGAADDHVAATPADAELLMPSVDFVFNKYAKAFPNTTRNARSVFNKFGSLYAYDGDNVSPGDGIKYRRRMSPTPIHAEKYAAKTNEHKRLLEEDEDYRAPMRPSGRGELLA